MIDQTIKNMLELPGVDGACILDKKGNLLLNELPDFFIGNFLGDLSNRVTALYDTIDQNYLPCDDYVLNFAQKSIQLRRNQNAYLLVAVEPSVNLAALRAMSSMLLSYITPQVLSDLSTSLNPIAGNHSEATPIGISEDNASVQFAAFPATNQVVLAPALSLPKPRAASRKRPINRSLPTWQSSMLTPSVNMSRIL